MARASSVVCFVLLIGVGYESISDETPEPPATHFPAFPVPVIGNPKTIIEYVARPDEPQRYVMFGHKIDEKVFQLVAVTNKPHGPVSTNVKCDGDFTSFTVQMARNENQALNIGPPEMHGKRQGELIVLSPSWDAMHPLLIDIYGASPDLRKCELTPLD